MSLCVKSLLRVCCGVFHVCCSAARPGTAQQWTSGSRDYRNRAGWWCPATDLAGSCSLPFHCHTPTPTHEYTRKIIFRTLLIVVHRQTQTHTQTHCLGWADDAGQCICQPHTISCCPHLHIHTHMYCPNDLMHLEIYSHLYLQICTYIHIFDAQVQNRVEGVCSTTLITNVRVTLMKASCRTYECVYHTHECV